MMEAGATQKAAGSMLFITRLFGIVDKNSSTLHSLFCAGVSIAALVLGARVLLTNLKGIRESTATPTLDLVALFYQV
jgi:hypothetical protein